MQSAIKLGDDGMRIVLDVPESELPKAIALISLRKNVLRVSIEADGNNSVNNQKSKIERLNSNE